MSLVVGMAENRNVWLCADSGSYGDDNDYEIRRDPKVFDRGPFIFGVVDSSRITQLIRFTLKVPVRRRGQDAFEYMATSFVESVRKCIKDGGASNTFQGGDAAGEDVGGTFLVGFDGRLFRVDPTYAIAEIACGYDAVGVGQFHALGALQAQDIMLARGRRNKQPMKYEPAERLLDVLTAAERVNTGVRKPFTTVQLRRKSRAGASTEA